MIVVMRSPHNHTDVNWSLYTGITYTVSPHSPELVYETESDRKPRLRFVRLRQVI